MATTKETARPDVDASVEEDVPRRSRRKLLLIGIVLGAIAVAVAMTLLRGGEEEPEVPVDGPVVEVSQMTANLAGSQMQYVRFGFAAVLREDVVGPDVEGRFPLLQDAALSEVQALPADVLRTPEGLQQLRDQLTSRAQDVYPDGEVLRIVLTELVVQ